VKKPKHLARAKQPIRASTKRLMGIHDETLRKLADTELDAVGDLEAKVESLVDRVEPLARNLRDLQERARALGIFMGDRELLACPNCGLAEDVLAGGQLVTYHGEIVADTGLRFVDDPANEERFTCPECGSEVRLEPLGGFEDR